ncbi:MAG TPA: carboxypeptidase-like regulatory domain-containing protein, partial [Sphingobacterium sp.]|nr:carboxypeptidase-like regulatory domain-containing protein [Sphingobacterium sp.]
MKYSNIGVTIVLIFVALIAQAQTEKTVRGMLRDSALRVVAGASVQLISSHDSLGTSSSVGGFYTFNHVKADKFKIKVSSIGFEPFEQEYTFPAGESSMMVPSIVLIGIPHMIEEVVVDGVVTVQVK